MRREVVCKHPGRQVLFLNVGYKAIICSQPTRLSVSVTCDEVSRGGGTWAGFNRKKVCCELALALGMNHRKTKKSRWTFLGHFWLGGSLVLLNNEPLATQLSYLACPSLDMWSKNPWVSPGSHWAGLLSLMSCLEAAVERSQDQVGAARLMSSFWCHWLGLGAETACFVNPQHL